jgi:hypothetical protein
MMTWQSEKEKDKKMTESEFCGVVALMLDQKYFYPEYPESFKGDCKALWMDSYTPEDAVKILAVAYGWIDDNNRL